MAVLLHEAGYSLQANRKTREGEYHPDRDAQFGHINDQVLLRERQGQPAISVDTKKKELLGDFKNGGSEWQPAGRPQEVRATTSRTRSWVRRSLTACTTWPQRGLGERGRRPRHVGVRRGEHRPVVAADGLSAYPAGEAVADHGRRRGSNATRCRLWKVCLQRLANRLGMPVSVCHFPPGTSKWNKIEHRMFCQITQNWRGRPLFNRALPLASITRQMRRGQNLVVEIVQARLHGSVLQRCGAFIEPWAKIEMLTAAEFGYPFLVDAQLQALVAPSRDFDDVDRCNALASGAGRSHA